MNLFFLHHSFFQLAQDEGSPVRGFGVVEYESAEQAEAVLIEMDRTLVGGQEVRLSLCTPGTSGRSTLAALIAAQGMVSTTLWSHDTLARSFSSHALQLCVCVCFYTLHTFCCFKCFTSTSTVYWCCWFGTGYSSSSVPGFFPPVTSSRLRIEPQSGPGV